MRQEFERCIKGIEDKRYRSFVEHKLADVLVLVMCCTLCGLDELKDFVAYGKANLCFLRETFGVKTIPSASTLTRVLNMVDGERVAQAIMQFMQELLGTDGDLVAFDGKTICATAKGNREKLHIITALLTRNGVVLGQQTVDEKTNEIPTMQEMLPYLDLEGKVVTADAMHCQRETSRLVREQGGDYIWGLKANQAALHDDVSLYMDDRIADSHIEMDTHTTVEKNAGRMERRTCYKTPTLDWLPVRSDWAGLSCAFAIDRTTQTLAGTQVERSYYISSLDAPASELLRMTREHWKIEALHWQLDVTFSEDACRVLSANGQKTLNIFRKLALALHKNYINATVATKTKPSVRSHISGSFESAAALWAFRWRVIL